MIWQDQLWIGIYFQMIFLDFSKMWSCLGNSCLVCVGQWPSLSLCFQTQLEILPTTRVVIQLKYFEHILMLYLQWKYLDTCKKIQNIQLTYIEHIFKILHVIPTVKISGHIQKDSNTFDVIITVKIFGHIYLKTYMKKSNSSTLNYSWFLIVF